MPKVDTTYALGCGQTTGSRATLFGGRAAVGARTKLQGGDLDAGGSPARISSAASYRRRRRLRRHRRALGAPVARIKTHTALRLRDAGRASSTSRNGRARIVAAHDVGRAVNPLSARDRSKASIHMGLGYALTEELVVRETACR